MFSSFFLIGTFMVLKMSSDSRLDKLESTALPEIFTLPENLYSKAYSSDRVFLQSGFALWLMNTNVGNHLLVTHILECVHVINSSEDTIAMICSNVLQ